MYQRARDLEIIYNLLWRSKPQQSDDRANIVGMHDIPATTLNWETFKSYLLKNSGSNANDISVSYIDSNAKEIPINGQDDFQRALYSFRRRARIGEIITLKLDKLNTRKSISQMVKSTDAEIQTSEYKDESTQPEEIFDDENPPKWFTKHMKKFEKKLLDEMKQQMALITSKIQSTTCQHSHPSRSKANKPESYKRSRKFDFTKVNLDKDMCKKYAFKLDELEHKTSKIKAKKLAAIKVSSDSDVGHTVVKSKLYQPINEVSAETEPPLNNVRLISSSDQTAGPLYTNSVYLQKWQVTNCGQSAWDENTELRYAWGAEKLRPTFTILKCPELQPGETGEISVYFQIPSTPGSYECFWHFYDCGRRFGHWIACQMTVIDYPRKTQASIEMQSAETVAPQLYNPLMPEMLKSTLSDPIDLSPYKPELVVESKLKQLDETEDLLSANNFNCSNLSNFHASSDSDNISILSETNSPHSGTSDYVVVPSPDTTSLDKQECEQTVNEDCDGELELEIEKNDIETISNIEVLQADSVSIASEANTQEREIKLAESETGDYAYVYYNGEKYPFHKDLLRPEYFKEAEKVEKKEERLRECSTSSQDSGKRLFVFPRHSPGFEVVYPADEATCRSAPSSIESEQFYPIKDGFQFPPESTSEVYADESLNESVTSTVDVPHVEEVAASSSSYNALSDTPASPTYGETRMTTSTTYTSPSMSADASKEQPKLNGRVYRESTNLTGTRENIITEAAILASSAMSTARNVVNRVINTGNGKWVNGHWIAEGETSKRESRLKLLAEMGFMNRDLNATLLARYNDDVHRVISELVQ